MSQVVYSSKIGRDIDVAFGSSDARDWSLPWSVISGGRKKLQKDRLEAMDQEVRDYWTEQRLSGAWVPDFAQEIPPAAPKARAVRRPRIDVDLVQVCKDMVSAITRMNVAEACAAAADAKVILARLTGETIAAPIDWRLVDHLSGRKAEVQA